MPTIGEDVIVFPESQIEIFVKKIPAHGLFPNNPKLPVLLYKKVIRPLHNDPQAILNLLANNGWRGGWIDKIYPFHHYHSNTHEVLVAVEGRCMVQMGGTGSENIEFEKRDLLLLPAGTSHKNSGASGDFLCVGAYPFDIEYDMNFGKEEEKLQATARIARVPLPETDPLYGKEGPIFKYWYP
jgi:uncharacterized protein YjlB